MRLRLVRHATILLEIGGHRLLIDPLLGPAGSQPPIPDTADGRSNPLVELTMPVDEVVDGIAAVLVTHMHPDHFDIAAAERLGDVTVLCQPGDAAMLARGGVTATEVPNGVEAGGLTIMRTGGRHGTGAIGREMGAVSGYVVSGPNEPTVYIAGDTIWCDEVADAIRTHEPAVIVVNAGAARFVAGDPITMDVDDVRQVCEAAPDAVVIAVHMEAINHCGLTRADLRAQLEASGHTVVTPADGETLQMDLAAS